MYLTDELQYLACLATVAGCVLECGREYLLECLIVCHTILHRPSIRLAHCPSYRPHTGPGWHAHAMHRLQVTFCSAVHRAQHRTAHGPTQPQCGNVTHIVCPQCGLQHHESCSMIRTHAVYDVKSAWPNRDSVVQPPDVHCMLYSHAIHAPC